MTATPHQSVGQVKQVMTEHRIQSMPVADPDGQPVGIVTTADLIRAEKDSSPIRTIMTEEVVTIPAYAEVSQAARTMRNHRIHHLVVTNEGTILGILSSYDLLRLVEDHRFVPKNAPGRPGRPRDKGGRHKRR